jgi:hypothetical protein
MLLWRHMLPHYDLLVVSQVSTLALHRTGGCRRLSLSALAYEHLREIAFASVVFSHSGGPLFRMGGEL